MARPRGEPELRSVTLSVRVTPSMYSALAERARQHDVYVPEEARLALAYWLATPASAHLKAES